MTERNHCVQLSVWPEVQICGSILHRQTVYSLINLTFNRHIFSVRGLHENAGVRSFTQHRDAIRNVNKSAQGERGQSDVYTGFLSRL